MTDVRLPSAEGRWRALAALVAAALVLATFPLGLAHAEDRVNMTQLTGADNVAAAVAWSKHAYATEAKNVVLGRSDLPPDNLASGLLQGVLDAPLLLTPSNSLHASVEAELERLKAVTVHILGGLSAVSAAVETKLRSEGYGVRRYSGTTRIETATAIANAQAGAATTALLARAFGATTDPTSAWADALAGGAWAADDSFPVLFTQTETLTTSTKDYLATSRIRTVNILGGTGAVSQAVEDQLKAMNIAVKRVSGATRFATAIAIAKERGYDTAGDTDVTSIVLADGQHTDGWAAGFAAAGYAADKPIVLSNGSALPTETDAWFAGAAAADKLVVAPYVTEAAAKAAADKMGLLKKAAVTLDATSFANNGNITGKVTPMDDVKSVAVSGPCVTAGAVTPNATTGAFSLPIASGFAPGSCALTFVVTYEDNSTQTNPFTVTITGPGPNATVMNGPELTTTTVSNQTDQHVVVRYTFDEAVTLKPAAQTNFKLADFTGELLPALAPDGDAVRPDPNDTKSVLAAFPKENFLKATTAVVLADALHGSTSQLDNPEGSRPLQNLTLAAGNTVLPDLTAASTPSVTDNDATSATNYVVRVSFTFDTAATAIDVNKYQLMDEDGDWREGESLASGDGGTTHVVDFVADSDGIPFANQGAADTYRGDVTRARVTPGAVKDAWDQENMDQTISTGAGTITVPKITSITLLPSSDQAQFKFASTVATADESDFFIYDHSGGTSPGTVAAIDGSDAKLVLVTFADVDGQETGGGTVDTSLLSDATSNDTAKYQTLGATNGEHPFAAGATLAPDLETVTRAATNGADPFGGSEVTAYTVTFRFSRDVEPLTNALGADLGLKMYSINGDDTEFNADDDVCERGETETTKKHVICSVTKANEEDLFNAVKNAVLFAVEEDAVIADGPVANYKNYPTSKVPSSS